jgi:flagellar secretion chaperone FliS
MNQANVKNYKKIEIESASPGKLLMMLFDGAVEFLYLAETYLEENDTVEANHYIGKVQAILTELMGSLNFDAGPVAANLFGLYEFTISQLVEISRSGSITELVAVKEVLEGLRTSWDVIINGDVTDVMEGLEKKDDSLGENTEAVSRDVVSEEKAEEDLDPIFSNYQKKDYSEGVSFSG